MELSSPQNSDILKSNRFTMYAHAANNDNLSQCDIFESEKIRKVKSTPRKCKTGANSINDAKMKKSSSLHNMEKLGVSNKINKDTISTSTTISLGRTGVTLDKQQIGVNSELLSRIEKEKKSYEATISELILSLEARKREKEMLLFENKRLTETVQHLQMDVGKWRNVNGGLRVKIKELGVEVEEEDDGGDGGEGGDEVMDASGDGGTRCSQTSLTLATVGDTNSIMSDEWQQGVEEQGSGGSARDILDSLSVSTLQDRIQKMEEDSYCTNEELQATMQELVDLQNNLDSMSEDNRNLLFERAILLESLCEQTSNLQRCRLLGENLKFLLLNSHSRDYPNLDVKLRELYSVSEDDNRVLLAQNEEFKQAIVSCQGKCRQLSQDIEVVRGQLEAEKARYSQLEEKYRDELWQREQVESVLKNHSESSFGKTVGWTDCSSGVLALIQQSKRQKQTDVTFRAEIAEKLAAIDMLTGKIRQLEEGMLRQGMKNKEENKGNIDQLRSQLMESEREVCLLNQSLDTLSLKYGEDLKAWRLFERDLLTAITAANSLKEDRDRDLQEVEGKLEASELIRKQLQEKVESQKSCIANHQTKERVMVSREQSSLSNTSSVKTLIQTLEYQMKPGNTSIKPSTVSTRPNQVIGTNTVPRLSLSSNTVKKEITRNNTVKLDTSPPKHSPEITIQKSSSFKNDIPQKQQQLITPESSQVLLQPLTTVVSQASSILQSVSRRNSVVTNPLSEHHSHFQPPAPIKPPSPVPTSTDPLGQLVKKTNKGSKRNALLYWCQTKTSGYPKIDITNFSSSWNDGLALCALLHSFDSTIVDFKKLADATSSNPDKSQKRLNFQAAFLAAEKLGIPNMLNIETMINTERPDWNSVMNYVIEIYVRTESRLSAWGPPLSN